MYTAYSIYAAKTVAEPWEALTNALVMEPRDCAMRFGIIDLPGRNGKQEWDYHPALGFSRRASYFFSPGIDVET